MCFSAPVSFTASLGLAAIGFVTLRNAHEIKELPIAAIPVLFSIQQFIEGMLWLLLPRSGLHLEQYWLTQGYAVFVGVVWPVLIPLSLLLIEPEYRRRLSIQAIVAVGIVAAFYTLGIIVRYGVSAEITNKCIVYQYPGDDHPAILTVYLIATCMAFLFSSHRSVLWIGITNATGFLIAYYFYRLNYTSVWCFFAAIVSGLIYTHFLSGRKRTSNTCHWSNSSRSTLATPEKTPKAFYHAFNWHCCQDRFFSR